MHLLVGNDSSVAAAAEAVVVVAVDGILLIRQIQFQTEIIILHVYRTFQQEMGSNKQLPRQLKSL
jgi:hypothetical protein